MSTVSGSVFWLSVGLLLYTLVGYPALLAIAALVRSRPIRKKFQPKTVTVLLPVRNGEQWLRAKLKSVLALHYPRELLQILVISDGSTDATDAIASDFCGDGVELMHIVRAGKATALNAGIEQAKGEILFLTDVRQELQPDCLMNLVACFGDPSVGVVSGELVIRDGETFGERSVGLYWRYEKWMRKRESELDSVMGATGCIYAMRRELAVLLPPGTLVDDMFMPLAAFFRGYRVVVEEGAKAYDYPAALDTEFARKVRTQAGVFQIVRAYPQLFSGRNRMLISFLSHKIARLLLPYCLISIAVTSLITSDPWRNMALAVQGLFYGAVIADTIVPDGFPLKSLTSPARSFCVLLIAALWAPWSRLRASQAGWNETRIRPARQV